MNLEKWIGEYVVNLQLCPFAGGTLKDKKWTSFEIDFKDYRSIEHTFYAFLKEEHAVIDSYFLTSEQLIKWEDFLFFMHFLEELVAEVEAFQSIKIVGFHPDYKHADVESEQVHYSNRAPWPLFQLLHSEDVRNRTKLMDIERVLEANVETLNGYTIEALQIKLDDCKR